MGFELKAKTATIVFEEGNEYHGAVVDVRLAASLGECLEIMNKVDTEDHEEIMRFAASQLVSWNIDVNGEPVPATYEGLMSLPDPRFVIAVLMGWKKAMSAMVDVDDPLDRGSSSGGTLVSPS